MRVVIADDEPVSLERLELALSFVPEAVLVGKASSGREALRLIQAKKPDVAVLDIQMPGLTGLEAAAELRGGGFIPEIIFVTAFEQHAAAAFQVEAVDYLLKPVAFPRFRDSLRRAKARIDARAADERFAELLRLMTALRDERTTEGKKPFRRDLWVREQRETRRVPVAEILFLKSEGDFVCVHTRNGAPLLNEPLRALEEELDPAEFVRVHRSVVVNAAAVRSLRRRGPRGLCVVLEDGRQLPVGPKYAKAVTERLTGKS